VTVRTDKNNPSGRPVTPFTKPPDDIEDLYALETDCKSGYLLARGAVCRTLHRLLFPNGVPEVGLILIAGATSTSKSRIAKGIVKSYLEDLAAKREQAAGASKTAAPADGRGIPSSSTGT
jgi:hypothetical protein